MPCRDGPAFVLETVLLNTRKDRGPASTETAGELIRL
jgi:hypothetical protein